MNLLDIQTVRCPYCGEQIELTVDASVPLQRYTEDCQVCCRPVKVSVSVDGSRVDVTLLREDD
ncbi:MAG: CPXCG motif-containing cysteine-rich protein [Mariprofundaceae bacterium]